MPRPRGWFDVSKGLALAIARASVASLVGLAVVRWSIPQPVLSASNDVVGNYLQTIGGIYAVLLAFVVYVVWGQFTEARALIDREAHAVEDLYRTMTALRGHERCAVRDGLRRYVDAVLECEFASTAGRQPERYLPQTSLLDATWEALHVYEPSTPRQAALFSEALKRFNDLSDARSDRLISAFERIPLALRVLLYGGAVIVVGSMWLFAVDRVAMHALITSAMAGGVSHVLYVIDDLDDPFAGDWQVDPAPLVEVREHMERPASAQVATKSSAVAAG